jgi:putative lipoprotein (rSAM/lipoprotein system)
MKIVKYKCLKTYNALIVFLISFLGFASSCDPLIGKAMYGTPSADFIVKGKVEAAKTNNPVAGIKVEMSMEIGDGTEKVSYLLNTTSSAEGSGAYKVTSGHEFPDDQTFKIKFTDTDGALNGEYETLDTTIVFQNPKFTGGDGHWYNGKTEKEVNVKLKPKK